MTLQEAIAEFRKHLSVARSSATSRTYGVALTHLAAYGIIEGVKTVDMIHPGHFLAYLGKEKRSPVTVFCYLTAISQFAEFSHEEGILKNGDYVLFKHRLRRLRGRAPERKIPSVPTEDAFQALLAEARKPFHGTIRQNLGHLRDLALVETLRSTGCRVAEAVSLRRRDLRNGKARTIGKGKKMRWIFFDDTAIAAIETYLSFRGPGGEDDPVFCRHDNRAKGVLAISTTSARNVIDRLAMAAGLDPGSVSPHRFRHRFASRILTSTGNLAGVQDLLGHASPTTTRIYARLTTGHLAGIHESVAL